MNKFGFFVAALLPVTAVAVDYPALKDPAHAAMLERYKVDRPKMEAEGFFTPPAPTASSGCSMSEVDLYQLAGLDAAHPDLKGKQFDRNGRRYFRAVEIPGIKMSWENIRFTVTDLPCENGVPHGLVKAYVSFDLISDSKTTTTAGTVTSTMTSHSMTHTDRWVNRVVQQGVIQDESAMYSSMLTKTESHHSDPAVDKIMQQSSKTAGTNNGNRTVVADYKTGHGATLRVGQFMIMKQLDIASVSSGKTKFNDVLITTALSGIDDIRSVSEMYFDSKLTQISRAKDGVMHGEFLSYMEDMFKSAGLNWRTQPGMEDAREVSIGGLALIETRSCFQDGLPAKLSPCPSE